MTSFKFDDLLKINEKIIERDMSPTEMRMLNYLGLIALRNNNVFFQLSAKTASEGINCSTPTAKEILRKFSERGIIKRKKIKNTFKYKFLDLEKI